MADLVGKNQCFGSVRALELDGQNERVYAASSEPDLGFSRFWIPKNVTFAICIRDMTHLGVAHIFLDHTGSIRYALEMFSVIFGWEGFPLLSEMIPLFDALGSSGIWYYLMGIILGYAFLVLNLLGEVFRD